jgi:hypothetical protein
MDRNSFVFYDSFYKSISKLRPEEQSLCLKALCDYCFKGELPTEDNPIVNMFFELVKPQVDKNNQRYENGVKGGRPKNQTITKPKPNHNQTITKTEKSKPNDNVNDNDNDNENVNVNDNVNVNVNVNDNENGNRKENKKKSAKSTKATQFQKPTKEDLKDFALQEQLRTDIIDEFMDYYESNGWRVGRGGLPMKDWKATYRRWCRKQYERPRNRSSGNEFLDMLKGEKIFDVEGEEQ